MALQTGIPLGQDEWEEFFVQLGIPASSAETYAEKFFTERLSKDSISLMNREMLKELGVKTLGDALAILKPAVPDSQLIKAPAVKLPQLHSEMTPQQFRKFRIDWEVFAKMTNMPPAQTNIQLYNCIKKTEIIIAYRLTLITTCLR